MSIFQHIFHAHLHRLRKSWGAYSRLVSHARPVVYNGIGRLMGRRGRSQANIHCIPLPRPLVSSPDNKISPRLEAGLKGN